jgi:hypothetical protein
MHHQSIHPTLVVLLFGAFLSLPGCVALNIPSQRFEDSEDHGGVLGPWRKHGHLAVGDSSHPQHCDDGAFAIDGGPLEIDPFDPTLDLDGTPKQPDVPWPRFHPVPTRPVFGSAPPL